MNEKEFKEYIEDFYNFKLKVANTKMNEEEYNKYTKEFFDRHKEVIEELYNLPPIYRNTEPPKKKKQKLQNKQIQSH